MELTGFTLRAGIVGGVDCLENIILCTVSEAVGVVINGCGLGRRLKHVIAFLIMK